MFRFIAFIAFAFSFLGANYSYSWYISGPSQAVYNTSINLSISSPTDVILQKKAPGQSQYSYIGTWGQSSYSITLNVAGSWSFRTVKRVWVPPVCSGRSCERGYYDYQYGKDYHTTNSVAKPGKPATPTLNTSVSAGPSSNSVLVYTQTSPSKNYSGVTLYYRPYQTSGSYSSKALSWSSTNKRFETSIGVGQGKWELKIRAHNSNIAGTTYSDYRVKSPVNVYSAPSQPIITGQTVSDARLVTINYEPSSQAGLIESYEYRLWHQNDSTPSTWTNNGLNTQLSKTVSKDGYYTFQVRAKNSSYYSIQNGIDDLVVIGAPSVPVISGVITNLNSSNESTTGLFDVTWIRGESSTYYLNYYKNNVKTNTITVSASEIPVGNTVTAQIGGHDLANASFTLTTKATICIGTGVDRERICQDKESESARTANIYVRLPTPELNLSAASSTTGEFTLTWNHLKQIYQGTYRHYLFENGRVIDELLSENGSMDFTGMSDDIYSYQVKTVTCDIPVGSFTTLNCPVKGQTNTAAIDVDKPANPIPISTTSPISNVNSVNPVEYQTSVGTNGGLNISIPLYTPASANNVFDGLELIYSSDRLVTAANEGLIADEIGTGWRLNTKKTIHQCARYSRDVLENPYDFLDNPDWVQEMNSRSGNSNEFGIMSTCFNGVPLVFHTVEKINNKTVKTAIPRIRDGSKFIQVEGEGWTRLLPDGRKETYGFSAKSKDALVSATQYLSKIEDTFGNSAHYSYHNDEDNGRVVLTEINYGPNSKYKIKFNQILSKPTGENSPIIPPRPFESVNAYIEYLENQYSKFSTTIGGIELFEDNVLREFYTLQSNVYSDGWLALNKIQKCSVVSGSNQCGSPLSLNWTNQANVHRAQVSMIDNGYGRKEVYEYSKINNVLLSSTYPEKPFGNPEIGELIPEPYIDREYVSVVTKKLKYISDSIDDEYRYTYSDPGYTFQKEKRFVNFAGQRIQRVSNGHYTYKSNVLHRNAQGQISGTKKFTKVFTGSELPYYERYTSFEPILLMHEGFTYESGYRTYSIALEPLERLVIKRETDQVVSVEHNSFDNFYPSQQIPGESISVELFPYTTRTVTKSFGDSTAAYVIDKNLNNSYGSFNLANPKQSIVSEYQYESSVLDTDYQLLFKSLETNTSYSGVPSPENLEETFSNNYVQHLNNGQHTGLSSSETMYVGDLNLEAVISIDYEGNGAINKKRVVSNGKVLSDISYANFVAGIYPQSTTNGLGHSSTISYDSFYGKPVSITKPNGLLETYQLSAAGVVTTSNVGNATATVTREDCSACNAINLNGSVAKPVTKVIFQSDNEPTRTNYYDAYKRIVQTVVADIESGKNIYTNKSYNSFGKISKQSQPFKTGQTPMYDELGYDQYGRLILATQANGGSIEFQFGVETGQQIETEITKILQSDSTVIEKSKTTKYDHRSKPVEIKRHHLTENEKLNYGYYANGRLKRVLLNDEETLNYEYDFAGNLTRVNDRDAGTQNRTFDFLNRIQSATTSLTSINFTYDSVGRLQSKYSPDGTEQYVYDPLGNVGAVDYIEFRQNGTLVHKLDYNYDSNKNISSLDNTINVGGYSATRSTTFKYNSNNSLKERILSSGKVDKYVYKNGYMHKQLNAANEVVREVNSITSYGDIQHQEWLGVITETSGRSAVDGYLSNRLVTNQGANILNRGFEHRTDGMIESWRDGTDQMSLSYDNLNRINAVSSDRSGTSRSDNFSYTDQGNLNTITSSDGVLDQISNINLGNGVDKSVNQLNSFYRYLDQVQVNYDAIGRVTSYVNGDASIFYDWSNRNKIHLITKGLSNTQFSHQSEFVYGIGNKRIYRKHTDNTGIQQKVKEKYYFGKTEVEYEYRDLELHETIRESDGSIINIIKKIDGIETFNTLSYIVKDRQGSYLGLASAAGTSSLVDYSSYGMLLDFVNGEAISTKNATLEEMGNRGFGGHEHLVEFDLIHMGGRIFDPVLGRFLSPDPFIYSHSNGQSFNRYSYVMNNTANYTDPSGFTPETVGSDKQKPEKKKPADKNNEEDPDDRDIDCVAEPQKCITVIGKKASDGFKWVYVNGRNLITAAGGAAQAYAGYVGVVLCGGVVTCSLGGVLIIFGASNMIEGGSGLASESGEGLSLTTEGLSFIVGEEYAPEVNAGVNLTLDIVSLNFPKVITGRTAAKLIMDGKQVDIHEFKFGKDLLLTTPSKFDLTKGALTMHAINSTNTLIGPYSNEYLKSVR